MNFRYCYHSGVDFFLSVSVIVYQILSFVQGDKLYLKEFIVFFFEE